jgi:hypothetical protein
MGAEAEQWTSAELRRLCRRRWVVVGHRQRYHVNNVLLDAWDIDHVLIGPEGILAIETKWSASSWTDTIRTRRAVEAAAAVRAKARKLERILASTNYGLALSVTPLVVLWPTAAGAPPGGTGGTQIAWGADLAKYLPSGPPLEGELVERAQHAIANWAARRDAYERTKRRATRQWWYRLRLYPAPGS